MARRKEKHIAPTYADFLLLFDVCSEELQQEYADVLRQQPRPATICGERVPENLNGLSYGQLDDLRNLEKREGEPAFELCRIIFGKVLSVGEEDVNVVFGFMNFCTSEIERINKLFANISQHEPTPEERAAGIDKLNFGSFGVLDWYAKRMGIVNQNEVRDVAWVRIYTCMKNDNTQQEFERRLQDVYFKKSKTHSKH